MKPGEIFLAQFPFGDVAGMKLRPVLLLTGSVGPVPEVLVAYISSVMPVQLLLSDLVIDPSKPEFRSTYLKMTRNRYWSEKFGVTPERLSAAVKKVGNSAAAVEKELKRAA